jgi:hypothetical protein
METGERAPGAADAAGGERAVGAAPGTTVV